MVHDLKLHFLSNSPKDNIVKTKNDWKALAQSNRIKFNLLVKDDQTSCNNVALPYFTGDQNFQDSETSTLLQLRSDL